MYLPATGEQVLCSFGSLNKNLLTIFRLSWEVITDGTFVVQACDIVELRCLDGLSYELLMRNNNPENLVETAVKSDVIIKEDNIGDLLDMIRQRKEELLMSIGKKVFEL